jgi:hypothetical protein
MFLFLHTRGSRTCTVHVTSCCSNLLFFQQGSSAANSNAPFYNAVACITLHRLLPNPATTVTTYQQPASSPWHPHSLQAQSAADVTCPHPKLPRSDTRGGVICPTARSQAVDCRCPPAVAAWTTGANMDVHRGWSCQLTECRKHVHSRDINDTINQEWKKEKKWKWFQSSVNLREHDERVRYFLVLITNTFTSRPMLVFAA